MQAPFIPLHYKAFHIGSIREDMRLENGSYNTMINSNDRYQGLLMHLGYWLGFVAFFTFIWGTYDQDYGRNLMIQIWSLPARLILVYGAILVIFPRSFLKGKYLLFVTYYLLLLVITGVFIQRPLMYFHVQNIYLADHKSEVFFKVTELMNTMLDVNHAAILPLGYIFFQAWQQSKNRALELEEKNLALTAEQQSSFIHLKEAGQIHKVFLKDILFIESLKNYVRVSTCNKEITAYIGISALEVMLPNQQFIRVHRSFIVAKEKIDSFSTKEIQIQGHMIPIGRKYKHTVKEELNFSAKGIS